MPLKDDDIKQLIAILQRGLSDVEESESQDQEKPTESIRTKKVGTKKTQKSKKEKRTNKFDAMIEKNMHKSDTKIDQLLSVHPPSIRSRDFDPVKVQCRVCQRVEEINPNLVFDSPSRYKCNKCSGAPG